MTRRRSARACNEPGCPELTLDASGACAAHRRKPWQTRTAPQRLRGRALQQRNARILHRHNGVCHVCGQPGATSVDHVIPLAAGGLDDDSNLRPIHVEPCHREKTAAESAAGRRREPRRRRGLAA